MARKPIVTRTIKETTVTYLAMNTETRKTEELTITLTRAPEKEEKLLKLIKAKAETATIKPVLIVETTENLVLYGIPEEQFIELATVVTEKTKNGSLLHDVTEKTKNGSLLHDVTE